MQLLNCCVELLQTTIDIACRDNASILQSFKSKEDGKMRRVISRTTFNTLETGDCLDNIHTVSCPWSHQLYFCFKRFSRNSEAYASEFLENLFKQ